MIHSADKEQGYAVYHANDPWAMIAPCENRWLQNRAFHYWHVAEIKAPLDQVFTLTNHDEEQGIWTSHKEIVWHAADAPVRSTSVGDVILSHETGQAWLVMPAGSSLWPGRHERVLML